MHENEISYSIRGCIYDVFNHFGPGLLESVYEAALFECLSQKGLSVEQEVPVGEVGRAVGAGASQTINHLSQAHRLQTWNTG
jgi:GxxExxY protein